MIWRRSNEVNGHNGWKTPIKIVKPRAWIGRIAKIFQGRKHDGKLHYVDSTGNTKTNVETNFTKCEWTHGTMPLFQRKFFCQGEDPIISQMAGPKLLESLLPPITSIKSHDTIAVSSKPKFDAFLPIVAVFLLILWLFCHAVYLSRKNYKRSLSTNEAVPALQSTASDDESESEMSNNENSRSTSTELVIVDRKHQLAWDTFRRRYLSFLTTKTIPRPPVSLSIKTSFEIPSTLFPIMEEQKEDEDNEIEIDVSTSSKNAINRDLRRSQLLRHKHHSYMESFVEAPRLCLSSPSAAAAGDDAKGNNSKSPSPASYSMASSILTENRGFPAMVSAVAHLEDIDD